MSFLGTTLFLALLAQAAPAAEVPRPEHPRPDAERAHWANLNGTWAFRFDPKDEGQTGKWFEPAAAEAFDRQIVVPFPWESPLSKVADTSGQSKVGWYRRVFEVPAGFPAAERVWLHFEAVDWEAHVWVNGKPVAHHEGGYTPFAADITEAVDRKGENVVVVRAFDPTDPELPTGKQVGWYTPSSGIWQTVWLEARPAVHITEFQVQTTIEPAVATIDVGFDEPKAPGAYVVRARAADGTVSGEPVRFEVKAAQPGARTEPNPRSARLALKVSEPKLWTPEAPNLYDVTLELEAPDGTVDAVKTYFGLRTIARGTYGDAPFERILLNGKPVYLRGALDQSFNPQGLYTAPSDEFLKNDIVVAKRLALNFLRIHIKPEEPRRLYWADRLGMLIMQDMPNTWRQSPRAREAWEPTMRATIIRDRNHPSIFSWVAFNETWGLGTPEEYRNSKDTQDWVKRMVAAIRELDPTRLVEDNSPCNYDHVSVTDLNSWHFYIDDHEAAKRHIAEVVERSKPGSDFNHCPGERMNSAPLINSEYGGVSAGGGDRDISWAFRDLTNLLRQHNAIQGYVYTELSDIEWEHNGFVDYDRTAKHFGYDDFLPDMWVNELQQPDFVGYGTPPVIVAKPGETIEVPVFISHYSDRADAPRLRWWLQGWDDKGDTIMAAAPRTIDATWKPYDVVWQEPIRLQVPRRPFVGALVLTLRDPNNQRFAVNYVNVVVRPDKPLPRIQKIGPSEVAVRFRPDEYARSRWGEPAAPPPGKVYGRGAGYFEYHIQLPPAVAKAKPESFYLRLEAGARAGRDQVDWNERVNPQDYPQSDSREAPTTLEITINGQRILRDVLVDDAADARGVLSHLNAVEHGSHGEIVVVSEDFPKAAREAIAAGQPLVIRFAVPEDAKPAGGLSIFGDSTGQYPFDPTLEIQTAEPLPAELGANPDASLAVDVVAARFVPILPGGDARRGEPAAWAYTTTNPGAGWEQPEFDAAGWKSAPGGFGTEGTPAVRVRTRWETPRIWLRTTLELPEAPAASDLLTLRLFHDEDVQVFVNGKPLVSRRGYVTAYQDISLDAEQKALFRPGKNTIAVTCRQSGGGQGIDVGLTLLKQDE